ncbi:hypothetical protein [Mycolicibacterium mucogenicum]|uniref:Uncharacterized protein n=1 Tax=Mycolicibacterium mucogenicum DSM 44124 TaxID=1226753 RepID=A0A8H2JH08_MYCMU|nr:hypothetical protein [Mycolicibacterium mucogenicum]KAB7752777.1 hypothetical protein MMUC44124_26595 [Mycolicibacterium mucogenicum DSM 44124]QPG69110.1 hypothetical protein C1S78_027610 [Mycolicibacterium mucogenicum DSM 44124]
MRYYHGGVPGLRGGDLIEPTSGTAHLVDGCPTCEARKHGQQLPSDDNDPTMVYVTTDKDYARIYAAGYPLGALYVVEPIGELVDRAHHDSAPSWGCKSARITHVYDPLVRLSPKETRRLMRKFGMPK